MDEFNRYFEEIADLIVVYGASILLAIVVFITGLWVIGRLTRLLARTLERRNVDLSLRPFLISIVGIVLKIMLVITVASMIGIEMTSFVAVLGAAGLAVGLALQGSLSNFAGGVLILILKPFKVGDYIESDSGSGTVREIQIFYTYLTTVQNQEIIVPNGELSNNPVKNYSFHPTRRLDMTFGIGYNSNIDKAKEVLWELIKADERFLRDPEPAIFVEELADSSVNFRFRVWTLRTDFWDLHNDLPEKVKKAFDREGLSIPFPQMDVHLFKEENDNIKM